ncbi:MAG: hypothetical protein K0R09_1647 [Clostridiales bacterium]|jgi:hypothetical protein|nr:hypothetical protein [Clostridiales bacterium]
MDKIEKILENQKINIENIEVPKELEARLRRSLSRKKKSYSKALTAAVVILALIFGYSYDAIAYYGKKILGYDKVAFGNLKELNEKGRGQEVGKSFTFSDGTKVTLDGIMFDDNKFTGFIRESSNIEIDASSISYSIKGINPFGYMQESGAGNFNEARTELNWVYDFEVPHFYEKWLTLEIEKREEGNIEHGSIGFTLDRSKAMGHTVKQDINKSIEIEDADIEINSIIVSPMAAVVEGSYKSERITDVPDPKIMYYVDFDLFINGNEYQESGGNIRGANNERAFSKEFNAVPLDVNSLQIKNIKFVSEILVDKMIKVTTETSDMKIEINETDISIKKVKTDGNATYITLKSQKYDETINSRYDPQIALFISGEQIKGEDITSGVLYEENGKKYIDRTFKFSGKGENMEIGIKVVYITEGSSEVINIPVK